MSDDEKFLTTREMALKRARERITREAMMSEEETITVRVEYERKVIFSDAIPLMESAGSKASFRSADPKDVAAHIRREAAKLVDRICAALESTTP